MVVRAVLGLLNAAALVAFGRSVQRAFGTAAGVWYALFQASQFHAMYYASRTLPNMFAFVFSKFAVCLLKWLLAYGYRQYGIAKSSSCVQFSQYFFECPGTLPTELVSAHYCWSCLPI